MKTPKYTKCPTCGFATIYGEPVKLSDEEQNKIAEEAGWTAATINTQVGYDESRQGERETIAKFHNASVQSACEKATAELRAAYEDQKQCFKWMEQQRDELRAAHASEEDIDLIVGALDSLGVALADEKHQWSEGEKTIYEEAIKVLWNQFDKVKHS